MITRAVCPVVVGREAELTRLEDALLTACRGTGNVVVLAGEAGMGKTRLAAEVALRASSIRAIVMEGACSEAELSVPYLPFLEAMGNYLATVDIARFGDQLGPTRRELARLFPQLGERTVSTPLTSDGAQDKLRLYEAIVIALQVVAADSGLLLILEDLHWADASTRELLDYVARRVKASPILVLATYRRGEMHHRHPLLPTVQGWLRSGLATVVELEPLAADGVARMVSAIFDEPTRNDTRDFFHARCEGNPFVLEELLKVAIDRGDVYRTESGWERRALSEFSLPATVRDSVLLRVGRLPPEQVEVLRIAAVLGRSFDDELLRDLCGKEIEDDLEAFIDQQLVDEEPGQSGRYRFRHALTQQAIYDSISRRKRERLHGEAAAVLRSRSAVTAVELASHLLLAKHTDEALPLLLEAAEDAERARAYREAAELRRRALEGTSDPLDKARLVGRIGECFELTGDSASGLGFLETAIEALHRLDRVPEAEHYRVLLGRSRWQHNRHDLAREAFQLAIDNLELFGPSRDLALALAYRGGIEAVSWQTELAEPFVRRAIDTAEVAKAEDVRILARNYLALVFGQRFLFEDEAAILEQSYQEALAADFLYVALNSLNNLQVADRYMGRSREAHADVDRLRGLHLETADLIAIQLSVGIAEQEGELEKALGLAREYVEASDRQGNPRHLEVAHWLLAHLLVMLGRLDEARRLIVTPEPDKSLQLATEQSRIWCEYHLAIGDPNQAAEGARLVASTPQQLIRGWPYLDPIALALIGAGDLTLAEPIADAIRVHIQKALPPQLLLVLARIELATLHPESALDLARRSAKMFGDRAEVLEQLNANIVVAQCLAIVDVESARTEALACIESARRMQARWYESQALEVARAVGVEPPPEASERLVTSLHADIRGYTAMTAARPPAEMVDRVSAFQRWAKQEIEQHHGQVDKFGGDAVIATFNLSGETVDHTRHALEAARAMGAKAALLDLPVGMGIAVGAAIVGPLEPGGAVSVRGEAASLANRLQAVAGPGEIVLSRSAYKRLSGLAAQPEALRLQGDEESEVAYRLQPDGPRTGHERRRPT